MIIDSLYSISPVEGRYENLTQEVKEYFNEYNLIKYRIIVEVKWLEKLFEYGEKLKIQHDKKDIEKLEQIIKEIDAEQAIRVKEIEEKTKHDVKAVEYFLREKFQEKGLEKYNHWIHFACTSEDINNIAYGIMIKNLVNKNFIINADKLISNIQEKANEYIDTPMLSHTHGQSATPTTVGKELALFAFRLNKLVRKIEKEKIIAKFNGTVGNFNTHVIAYPDINWIKISKEFVESFDLDYNLYTTQIETHDNICMIFSEMKLFNNILLDFNNDMWMYISRNYFLQNNVKGEVGSSVMPHKINPINFENSMANIRMANGILTSFIDNLEISRMQRDLSDSSMLRNIGLAVAYMLIAIKQSMIGINKLKVNIEVLEKELHNNPEVLSEAIQTILRKNGYQDAYEILKELTRGKKVTNEEMKDFISKLDIATEDKERLLNLTPKDYIGLAPEIARKINDELK